MDVLVELELVSKRNFLNFGKPDNKFDECFILKPSWTMYSAILFICIVEKRNLDRKWKMTRTFLNFLPTLLFVKTIFNF